MSRNANDLRTRRSRESLQDALVALVAEKGQEEITVGDIAQRARVNRTTFYRHYRDKYELLEGILARAIEELDESMGPPQSRRSRFTLEEVPGPWIVFFQRIEKNAALYRAILHSSGGTWFQDRLRMQVERLLERGRGTSPFGKRDLAKAALPREIAVAFSASLFVGAAIWWLKHGKRYGAADVAMWLRMFFLKGYAGSV
jgi:AcrR family transcriptional regulator